jgi:hypothetical protein
MPITKRTPRDPRDKDTVETGVIELVRDGVAYSGTYRVRAEGSGRQRYSITPNKYVSVSHGGHTKGTSIGERGLDEIVAVLLRELVSLSPEPAPRAPEG